MPELHQSRNNALNQSFDMVKRSIDTIQTDVRKPRKILMPHLVNRARFDSISDL